MINAPVGFRFNPAEEELVRYYLANRVSGNSQDLWPGLINEFDMYSEEPWELWGRFYRPNLGGNNLVEAKSDKYIYLFTTLKKVASGGNGKRVNRRVRINGGTWHEQNTKSVKRVGRLSWYERRFSYKNDKCKEQDCGWLMMEFCFHEDDSLVLCRIGKKPLRVDDVSTRGRSPGITTTFQSYSPVVYDVNDDNFSNPGTKAKRMMTEGIFSGSSISIGDEEQLQHHGGVECGSGNQGTVSMGIPYHGIVQDQGGNSFFNPTRIDEVGAMSMEIPYHGIDQDQGDNSLFNATRIDEFGAMNMGIPYHHVPDFGASNQGIDGSLPTTCMEGMNDKIQMGVEANISSTLSGPVLIESGLLESTSIGVVGGLYEQTSGIGNIGEADQEDHIEAVGPENNATMNPNTTRMQEEEEEVEADMGISALDDPIGEPDHDDNVDLVDLDNVNGGPITTRMQEEDMATNGLDDLRRRMQAEDMEGNNCDYDISLPGLMNWDELEESQMKSFDEWIGEYEINPIQRIDADH